MTNNGLPGSSPPICNLQFAVCNLQSCCPPPQVDSIDLLSPPTTFDLGSSIHSLTTDSREVQVAMNPPCVRSLGKLRLEVSTQGWRFPVPIDPDAIPARPGPPVRIQPREFRKASRPYKRLQPSSDTV